MDDKAAFATLSASLQTAQRLVGAAVENAGKHSSRRAERWFHVRNLFGLGSAGAIHLCKGFGHDPFEQVGGRPDDDVEGDAGE